MPAAEKGSVNYEKKNTHEMYQKHMILEVYKGKNDYHLTKSPITEFFDSKKKRVKTSITIKILKSVFLHAR